MSEIDRALEDLFASDARARRVGRVSLRAPQRSWLPVALAAAGTAVIAAAVVLPLVTGRGGVAGPDQIPPAGSTPSPTPTLCQDTSVVIPGIAGTKSGRFMGTSIDRVSVRDGVTEWHIRFFIGPGATGDPGTAAIGLAATLEGPEGTIPVRSYAAGPPNGPFTDLTGPLTVQPCRPVVLRVTTASIRDGAYTLTLANIRRPEGDVVTESYSMRLVCEATPSGALECRNPAGTRSTFTPVPTSTPAATSSPARIDLGRIEGRTAYPSSFRPPLTVYAIDVDDPRRFHSVDVRDSNADPRGSYQLEVRPGTYHVVAYLTERPDRPGNAGIYSEYVICGLTVRCSDHTLIKVTVAAGQTVTGIDPSDWYYDPATTTYPPRPD